MRELTLEELEQTTGLRELTPEELELTAGGYDTRYNDGGDGWDVIGDGGDDSDDSFPPDTGDSGDSGGGDGDSRGGSDTTPAGPDAPHVTLDVSNPANFAKLQQAAVEMQNEVNAITAKIDALSDGARIQMPDGSEISGKDLKELWSNIDFQITDRTTFGTDRGGAYDRATGIATFNVDTVMGWDAWTGGLAFILLHEVAHSSAMGAAVDLQMWTSHLANGGTASNYNASSPYFQENEEFSNIFALQLTGTLGLALAPTFEPTNGYEYGDLTR